MSKIVAVLAAAVLIFSTQLSQAVEVTQGREVEDSDSSWVGVATSMIGGSRVFKSERTSDKKVAEELAIYECQLKTDTPCTSVAVVPGTTILALRCADGKMKLETFFVLTKDRNLSNQNEIAIEAVISKGWTIPQCEKVFDFKAY